VVSSIQANYVRIATPIHGFDVFGLDKPDLVGSKVLFSGYLQEDHTFNDDVVRGKIDAVLMSAAELEAEASRVAAEQKAHEEAHPTCKTRWTVCVDTSDLAENNPVWEKVRYSCKRAGDQAARYGAPQWSWVPFDSYLRGDDFLKTGNVTAIDSDVRFQNGFGIYGRSRVVCIYNLNEGRVVNVSVSLQ
jgi:hypothetical protein